MFFSWIGEWVFRDLDIQLCPTLTPSYAILSHQYRACEVDSWENPTGCLFIDLTWFRDEFILLLGSAWEATVCRPHVIPSMIKTQVQSCSLVMQHMFLHVHHLADNKPNMSAALAFILEWVAKNLSWSGNSVTCHVRYPSVCASFKIPPPTTCLPFQLSNKLAHKMVSLYLVNSLFTLYCLWGIKEEPI